MHYNTLSVYIESIALRTFMARPKLSALKKVKISSPSDSVCRVNISSRLNALRQRINTLSLICYSAHPQPSAPRVIISSLIYSVRPVYVSSRLSALRQRINTLKLTYSVHSWLTLNLVYRESLYLVYCTE